MKYVSAEECVEWKWIMWKNRMLMKERVWLNLNNERSYGMGLGNDYEDDGE